MSHGDGGDGNIGISKQVREGGRGGGGWKARKRESRREDLPKPITAAAEGNVRQRRAQGCQPHRRDRAGQDGGGSWDEAIAPPAVASQGTTPTPTPARPALTRPHSLHPAPQRPLPSPWRCPERRGGRYPSARPTPGCRSWRPPWPSPFALRCPLPARMRHHQDGGRGTAGPGWSRKRLRDSSPSITTARGALGGVRATLWSHARIGRAAPCWGGLSGRTREGAANALPSLSFFNGFAFKKKVLFPQGPSKKRCNQATTALTRRR